MSSADCSAAFGDASLRQPRAPWYLVFTKAQGEGNREHQPSSPGLPRVLPAVAAPDGESRALDRAGRGSVSAIPVRAARCLAPVDRPGALDDRSRQYRALRPGARFRPPENRRRPVPQGRSCVRFASVGRRRAAQARLPRQRHRGRLSGIRGHTSSVKPARTGRSSCSSCWAENTPILLESHSVVSSVH